MSYVYDRPLTRQAEIRDTEITLSACSFSAYRTGCIAEEPAESMSYELQVRQAVLLSFCNPVPPGVEQLFHLSYRKWQEMLHWLDISGLALYFLDRITQLGLRDAIPQTIVKRLQQNINDNIKRTRGMIAESVALQREFQKSELSYAVMKGISLTPISVPQPELRHQFDLDYLIAEESAPEARRILENRGYRLYAISGRSWEFKINETPNVSTKDLYKDLSYRTVELHLEMGRPNWDSRLNRITYRPLSGIAMPVLSPVDLFLGQAMHLFKDVCSAFSRSAHLLEFYRHVEARHEDDIFWSELRSKAGDDRRACLGIGVVTYLVTSIMGEFAPESLQRWTVETLPSSVRLWVDLYGRRSVLCNHPGTKLYLLLQKELEAAGIPGKCPIHKLLLPRRLPLQVIRASPGEAFPTRIGRYHVQVRFLLSRLRFHFLEGIRYALESRRWRKYLEHLPSC